LVLTPAPTCGAQAGGPTSTTLDRSATSHVLTTSEAEVVDLVNHPPHYGAHPSGVECITITEQYNFNVGNAIKYLWRAGLKEGTDMVLDLQKAAWYVNREIQRCMSTGE